MRYMMNSFARNDYTANPVRCELCGQPNPNVDDGYTTCCNELVVDFHCDPKRYNEAKREWEADNQPVAKPAPAAKKAPKAKKAAKPAPVATPTPKAERADKAHAFLVANGWSTPAQVAAHLGLTGPFAAQAAVATLTGLCRSGRAWKAQHAGKAVYTAR